MSLYHEAAEVLLSSPSEGGGSLKARVFRRKDGKAPPGQLYGLVLETCKWSVVLKEVIERAGTLKLERKLTPALALLLTHDLLLSRGGVALPQGHGLRQSIERHKGRLTSELTLARLRRKLPTLEALREQVEKAAAGEEAGYPRWVRVNALKSSVEEELETTFARYARAGDLGEVTGAAAAAATGGKKMMVYVDAHVPGLLAVTQGTDLSKTEAYASGKIILQDKASCFPAYLLDPRSEDGDVIDACAAPGNKTTHLAAILHTHRPEFESPRQTVYAFEKDVRRSRTLEKMVKTAGSTKTTRIAPGQDFLQVDPTEERYRNVGALLLDPSCSGSGIVGRDSMPELHLPEEGGDAAAGAAAKSNSSSTKRNKKKKKKSGDGGQENPRKRTREEETGQNIMVDDEGVETVVESDKDLRARLRALSSFQLSLVLHALEFPSARKVTYSTCSVHAEENEQVVMGVLGSEVARRRGWRVLRRDEQVGGMRDWPVRGLAEACGGSDDVAQGCIRSYKGDGRGVMGFFVVGFVRDGDGDGGEVPYLLDDEGAVVRDALGMPVLRSSGLPVTLEAREEEEEEVVVSGASPSPSSEGESENDEEEEEEEWAGLDD